MSEKKICPFFLSDGRIYAANDCIEDKCAWWIGECAIVAIARGLAVQDVQIDMAEILAKRFRNLEDELLVRGEQ